MISNGLLKNNTLGIMQDQHYRGENSCTKRHYSMTETHDDSTPVSQLNKQETYLKE
jgi:hypothetical protein